MKEYQFELKVKGEGVIYPYIVSAMEEQLAEQDSIQMILRDFPIFNGKEISIYKTVCINKGDIIEETIEIIKQIYKKYSTGGALHIVIDDLNTGDEYILWCLQNSIIDENFCDKEDRKMFEQCAINLIKINENKRKYIIQKALENWDLLEALYIIALGDKENSIKTINSLLKVNYSDDVKNLLITLKNKLNSNEE